MLDPISAGIMVGGSLLGKSMGGGGSDVKAVDPYAGTGSQLWVAKKYGVQWFGSEADPTYAKVANMWHGGKWARPTFGNVQQPELF